MKKLSKLKLQDAKVMNESEMKHVVGGLGYNNNIGLVTKCMGSFCYCSYPNSKPYFEMCGMDYCISTGQYC